jgi:hypothetical protein
VYELALVAETRRTRDATFGHDDICGPVVSLGDERPFRVCAQFRESGIVWLSVVVGTETSGEFTPLGTVISWPSDRASALVNTLGGVLTVFNNPLADPNEVRVDFDRILDGYRRRLGIEVDLTGSP